MFWEAIYNCKSVAVNRTAHSQKGQRRWDSSDQGMRPRSSVNWQHESIKPVPLPTDNMFCPAFLPQRMALPVNFGANSQEMADFAKVLAKVQGES